MHKENLHNRILHKFVIYSQTCSKFCTTLHEIARICTNSHKCSPICTNWTNLCQLAKRMPESPGEPRDHCTKLHQVVPNDKTSARKPWQAPGPPFWAECVSEAVVYIYIYIYLYLYIYIYIYMCIQILFVLWLLCVCYMSLL